MIVVGTLLALISKEEASAAVPVGNVDIIAYCPKIHNADGVKKNLEGEGRSVATFSVTYGVPVPNGYRLVVRGSKNMLTAVNETLKVYNLPSAYLDNHTALQLNSIFKTEKEARAKAENLKKRVSVPFKVEENTKRVKKPCVKIMVSNAPKADEEAITSALKNAGCVDVNVKDLPSEKE